MKNAKMEKHRKNITEEDIRRSKKDVEKVMIYIRKFLSENPELNENEAIKILQEKFIEDGNKYFRNLEELAGVHIQKNVAEYLLENEEILCREYNRIKDKKIEENDEYYTYNIRKAYRHLIKTILVGIREKIKTNPKEEYEILKGSLQQIIPILKEKQIEGNINSLLQVKAFFDKYGIFEKLINQYNNQVKSIGLKGLVYNAKNTNNELTEIEDFFDKSNLENLSVTELSVLNIFWQNKYAKELPDIGFGYFVIQQLGGITNINSIDNISDEDIRNMLLKYKTLENVAIKMYEMEIKKERSQEEIDKIGEEYEEYFKLLMPNFENSFEKDVEQTVNFFLAGKNAYVMKDNLICGTVIEVVDNKKIKNWGYIEDNYENSKYILIGVDLEGYNRPVKVHISRDLLTKSLMGIKDTNIIPIYEGEDDFVFDKKQLNTQVILPLSKEHKKYLRTDRKAILDSKKHKILAHTIFLGNHDKFPEHLKQEKDGKKQRVRRYVEVPTGKIFIEDGKKIVEEFKEDEDQR